MEDKSKSHLPFDFIKFLGTGGARFVVSQQLRASGGIWLSCRDTQVLIDPGPGSLVKSLAGRPKLDPLKLNGLILTHRHLDHSSDINIMIEAMTEGGYQKKGIVFAPTDALDGDPVVLKYVRSYLDSIEILKEGKSYLLGSISFSTPVRHYHPVETYGLKLFLPQGTLSLIADTLFFPEIIRHYKADCLIINVVLLTQNPHKTISHLSLDDVKKIITEIRPKKTLLTHFGTAMLKAKPWQLAEDLSNLTGIHVIACSDGMTISLEELFR